MGIVRTKAEAIILLSCLGAKIRDDIIASRGPAHIETFQSSFLQVTNPLKGCNCN